MDYSVVWVSAKKYTNSCRLQHHQSSPRVTCSNFRWNIGVAFQVALKGTKPVRSLKRGKVTTDCLYKVIYTRYRFLSKRMILNYL